MYFHSNSCSTEEEDTSSKINEKGKPYFIINVRVNIFNFNEKTNTFCLGGEKDPNGFARHQIHTFHIEPGLSLTNI